MTRVIIAYNSVTILVVSGFADDRTVLRRRRWSRDSAGVTDGNHRKLAEDTLNGNDVQDTNEVQV